VRLAAAGVDDSAAAVSRTGFGALFGARGSIGRDRRQSPYHVRSSRRLVSGQPPSRTGTRADPQGGTDQADRVAAVERIGEPRARGWRAGRRFRGRRKLQVAQGGPVTGPAGRCSGLAGTFAR
jgi:hypothetical protein